MAQYKVRSGQNIYDVALTLYGSIEGIFDLLISNEWLNMETQLSYGMVLNYHEEFAVNKSIVIWLKDNNVLVKNGEHIYHYLDIEELVKSHIATYHSAIYNSLSEMSSDEQNMYWESLYTPRMVIHQQGKTTEEHEVEHCYKGSGKHIITLYGDFECSKLDFRELNGIYYPLGTIYADEFLSVLNIEDLNKLIITQ